MRKKIIIALFSFGISLTLLNNVYGDALSDYKAQLEEIQKQQKETANKLEGVEQEIANYIYDITVLDGQITIANMRLKELEEKVDAITEELTEQETALQTSAQTYNAVEEVYLTRLRVIYENGMPTVIDVLLTSNSITDFFSKVNVLKSVVDYDKSLVSNLQNQKQYIDNIKSNIEFQKTQLEMLKYDSEKSKETLENALSAKEAKVSQMQSSKTLLEQTSAALAKQEEEAANNIQAEIIKMKNDGTFSGQFYWPVPNFYIITATMGYYDPWNTGSSTYHSGTDIAGYGIDGTPIYAMESGTVTLARWYGGYGNCVIIDHGTSLEDGKNYKTLYGHARSLAVVPGQKVSRGQVIAYVGSTGNSTGAHLHLEIWENNVRKSVLQYFEGLKFTYR